MLATENTKSVKSRQIRVLLLCSMLSMFNPRRIPALLWFMLLLSASPVRSQQEAEARDDAATYAALASSYEKLPERLPDLRGVLERGLKVALRDRDLVRAEWFGTRLKAAGGSGAISLLARTRDAARNTVVVPGGMKALMFVARGREPGSPERSLAEYARTVLTQFHAVGPGKNEIVERIQEHFKRVQALETFGTRSGSQVALSLSTRGEQARQRAAQVLDLLGWALRVHGDRVTVAPAENSSKSQRQVTASALELDELAMQSALQGGTTFDFTVKDEQVPVLIDEPVWREQLRYAAYPGGFAEALAHDRKFALTYAGLSELGSDSISALVSGIGLANLVERYAEALYYFSSALAVTQGRVLLPGGDAAAAAWSGLVKANPLNPAEFLSALLRVDEGRLLAYFFAVSQLDWPHQQFFTRSPSRISRFFALFKDSIGVRGGVNRGLRECPFSDFLSDVPLDENGHVVFPGGPEPWLVARGHGSVAETARLMTKVSQAVAPEVEDDILMRLARTRYEANYTECSELDNFLAVARVESHRKERLDARTALLLAQQFNRYRTVWPYLSTFTGLGYGEYSGFFALGERLGRYPRLEANEYLGQLGSLLELLSLLHQSGRLDEATTTQLFRVMCARFAGGAQPGQFAAASLDTTREMLKTACGKDPVEDPDTMMRDLLTGAPAPFRLEWKGRIFQVDNTAVRRSRYMRVLQLQRVTPLGSLFRIYDSLRDLARQEGPAREPISRIQAAVAEIPTVDIPGSVHFAREEQQNLETFQPRIIAQLAARLSLPSLRQSDLPQLTQELMAALSPQVKLALAGIVYAFYLDPEDLLVSDDPLFLRKHQFVFLRARTKAAYVFPEHKLERNQTSGSSLVGSFAGFGQMAGHVTLISVQANAGGSEFYAAAQIGSLRSTRWDKTTDEDLRLTGLKIRAAREWIVESALSPQLRSALSQATLGLLSLTRRGHLLRSLEAGDWDGVWRAVTLSDLYYLGDDLLHRYPDGPWPSPTLVALRRAAALGGRWPDWLGQDLQELMSCSHPHLIRLAPYERYERLLLPEKLAERASEFKLYLAEFMDRIGMPARALETVSEPLARSAFRDLALTDRRDWRAVLDSFSRLDESMIEQVISKTWPERNR